MQKYNPFCINRNLGGQFCRFRSWAVSAVYSSRWWSGQGHAIEHSQFGPASIPGITAFVSGAGQDNRNSRWSHHSLLRGSYSRVNLLEDVCAKRINPCWQTPVESRPQSELTRHSILLYAAAVLQCHQLVIARLMTHWLEFSPGNWFSNIEIIWNYQIIWIVRTYIMFSEMPELQEQSLISS